MKKSREMHFGQNFCKGPIIIILTLLSYNTYCQKFYLGNYLEPTQNEFELIGISSKTNVKTYRYKNDIYDTFFDRKIDDIIIGVKDGVIVTTIYNLIPRVSDKGVPSDILLLLKEKFPYPFKELNGIYGLNLDNETISITRVSNAMTFQKDRIMFMTSLKQSILEQKGFTGGQIARIMFGDWSSDQPIKLNHTTLKGFDIIKPDNGFLEGQWNSEGVMYDHLENGARVYPSSFDYFFAGNVLKIKIMFSAAGLREGQVYEFGIRVINEKKVELRYGDVRAIYIKQ